MAGLLGSGLIGALSGVVLPLGEAPVAGVIVTAGGLAGITADSLLGATIEGDRLGNQAVNFCSTLTGGITSAGLAMILV